MSSIQRFPHAFTLSERVLPLGRTLYLWRTCRNMTQAELSVRTQISRPNLSMIEQDARDVTVGTIRRLAQALEIPPGFLVDGIAPEHSRRKLTRQSLDRIARYLLKEQIHLAPRERKTADLLGSLVKRKLELFHSARRLPRTARKEVRNWAQTKTAFDPAEINNLLGRLEKRSQGPP